MERLKIQNLTFAAFIIIGGMVGTGSSYGATLEGTIFDATGIDGLVVGTVTYNVAFKHDAYNSVYATTPPTFLGDETGAQAAATALASALVSLQVRYLTGLDQTLGQNALVPYNPPLNASAAQCTPATNCAMNIWSAVASPAFDPSVTYADVDFTVFTQTPLPAALPLFASGLGALGLLGWRRKRKVQAAA